MSLNREAPESMEELMATTHAVTRQQANRPSSMKEVRDAAIEEIFLAIHSNLIPIQDIDQSGSVTTAELLRGMTIMQYVLVLPTVIDVRPLPESERPMVDDIRVAATNGHSLAKDLILKRTMKGVRAFAEQYLDAMESVDFILDMINQRLAYRFCRMTDRLS
jgi:hypothetical protein